MEYNETRVSYLGGTPSTKPKKTPKNKPPKAEKQRVKNSTQGQENTPKTNQNGIIADELPMYPTMLLTIGKYPLF